jgi:predicted ArsR family transcriptional regulator
MTVSSRSDGRYSEGVSTEGADIAAVAALADDLRRRMYAFIRQADHPVTRDEAAQAVGISRKLAAFHLDKLVATGLLRASSGRLGRVGRAPKVYQPAEVNVQVSIPAREHAVLAEILLEAATGGSAAAGARQAALDAAAGHGRRLGASERARGRPGRLGAERALTIAVAFLARFGYEPVRAAPELVLLRNCPFQPLAGRAPDLVCGINHSLLGGFLEGLSARSVMAEHNPRPGNCCVELRAARPA